MCHKIVCPKTCHSVVCHKKVRSTKNVIVSFHVRTRVTGRDRCVSDALILFLVD